ncbi:hypothetical protein HMSSN139_67300 [Paenibacillus sp. HMSSN-139]|jgi:hypothetical protein|nr:hypothetical protein HMSSN139_67300 [Paenibacillus sp. HMSSN-139]
MVTDEAYLCECSRDIKNVRLNKNISLEEVSNETNIPVDALVLYEDKPCDIPLTDAVKLLSMYKTDFKSIRFNRFQ